MNKERTFFADGRAAPPEHDVSDDEIDLSGIVRTLWRGKGLIFSLALVGFSAGWYYATYRVTPYYRADAILTLEVAGEQLVNFQRVTDGFYGDDAAVTTEKEVIASRTMLGKLADELDLVNHPEFNPALRPAAACSAWRRVGVWLLKPRVAWIRGTEFRKIRLRGRLAGQGGLDGELWESPDDVGGR